MPLLFHIGGQSRVEQVAKRFVLDALMVSKLVKIL